MIGKVQNVPNGTSLNWVGCQLTPAMWTLTNAMGTLYDGYWDRATRQAAVITLGRAVVALEREQTLVDFKVRTARFQN
jgi:hypothetical protein